MKARWVIGTVVIAASAYGAVQVFGSRPPAVAAAPVPVAGDGVKGPRGMMWVPGDVTTAERKPDWEALRAQLRPGTPKPPDSALVPGDAKQRIVEFVQAIAAQGGKDCVAPRERIAVFDNDGTLWAEQPLYFQFVFALDRIKALSPKHKEWKEKEPFASILKGDVKGALKGGEKSIAPLLAATHAGITTAEYEKVVKDWLATAQHPKLKQPYTGLAYRPMIELLEYLRANGFKTFIVSGGGVEFIRAFAEQVYGIPPEQVIGSAGKQKLVMKDGKPVIIKLPNVDFVDDKEGKPLGIQKYIGRRPIAAFGNSDGDLQMLQWTMAGEGRRLALLVRHDDAEREWAYDRQSSIGRLDKALDEATAKKWIVVSMKADWKKIFAFEK